MRCRPRRRRLKTKLDLSVRFYITGADDRYHLREVSYDDDCTVQARYRKYRSKAKTNTVHFVP
jgi:hypothetical protein